MAESEDCHPKLLGLLGLAHRAGKLALGASSVERLVRKRQKPLVIIASDAGHAQRRKMFALTPVRGFVVNGVDGEGLARALGRKKLVVVAVADAGFVAGINKLGLTISDVDGRGRGRRESMGS